MAHFANPLARQICGIAIIKSGDHLLGQHSKQILAVNAILFLEVIRMRIIADGEPVISIINLAPPTIHYAAIEAAVRGGFHAARAAGFERAAGIV